MAQLLSDRSKEAWIPEPDGLIGRGPKADLKLKSPRVSKEHARILWRDGSWWIRDLGSSNGTFLNGNRLAPGVDMKLTADDGIGFGSPAPGWLLQCDDPPPPAAVRLSDGVRVFAQGGILPLPSQTDPAVTVYQRKDGHWRARIGAVELPVSDAQMLIVGSDEWRLELAPQADRTLQRRTSQWDLATTTLHFTVSQDEERVGVVLQSEDRTLQLPSRKFHYLLLVLARRRVADQTRGHPADECGWVDRTELYKMMQSDREALNKDISRARKQLADLDVARARDIIEVFGDYRRIGLSRLVLG